MVQLWHLGLVALVGLRRGAFVAAQETEEPQPVSPSVTLADPTAPVPVDTATSAEETVAITSAEPPTSVETASATAESSASGAAALPSSVPGVNITDISELGIYGLSPPVYPSPNGTGTGGWNSAYTKAKALVAKMTREEKVRLTGGYRVDNGCSGSIPPIARLNFTGLCLSDAGNGLRSADFVSSWPAGLSVGASWNRNLANQRAIAMANEFKVKGVNIALGPVVGPLGRIATGGRNWEGFSNDPYLSGAFAYTTIRGIQGVGVTTSTKHFIGNEQETNRNPTVGAAAISSNIDDKTMHELYLWPFQDSVRAGTGNIMCSYQKINNSYGCANSKTQNGLLKTELGFQGFIVSDWGAQHSGVASANAGLDMVMPNASPFWGNTLTEAVANGSVPESRLTDMVTRIIATWYKMNQDRPGFPAPGAGLPRDLTRPHAWVVSPANATRSNRDILFNGAVEGHVLLKNEHNALPLKSPRLISLFGYSAKAPDHYTPGSGGWNSGANSLAPSDRPIISQIAANGTLYTGGGSGANQPSYVSSPFEALSIRARNNGTKLWWDFHSFSPSVDPTSDACIVVGNAFASEGWDRPGLHDDFTDGLILNVARKCRNTIVVFHNAGVRLVDQFIDHPNVTALLFAHLPGQESGYALASILYGESNPSGKLPYTVARNESDYGPLANESLPDGAFSAFPQSDFFEGVYIDYKSFDARNVTPRYEFGFGLSYTNFTFEGIKAATSATANLAAPYPTGPIFEGGRVDLYELVASVSADVRNSGSRPGAEVVQLYLGIPGGPVRVLRGFEKINLLPGQSGTVTFDITRRDMSTWDTTAQEWLLQNGTYGVYVGGSSRDLPLVSSLDIVRGAQRNFGGQQ